MALEELKEALEWQHADEVFQCYDYAVEERWEVSNYKVYSCGEDRRLYLVVIKWMPRKVTGAPYKTYARRVYDLVLDEKGYAPLTTEAGAVFAGVCVPGDEPHFCGLCTESARDHEPRNLREVRLSKEEDRRRSQKQSYQRAKAKKQAARSKGVSLRELRELAPGHEASEANEGQGSPQET